MKFKLTRGSKIFILMVSPKHCHLQKPGNPDDLVYLFEVDFYMLDFTKQVTIKGLFKFFEGLDQNTVRSLWSSLKR